MGSSDGPGHVRISLSANPRFVRPLRLFIVSLCELMECDEEETDSIALIATEILHDMVEKCGEGGRIEVKLTFTGETFRFEASDGDGASGAFEC